MKNIKSKVIVGTKTTIERELDNFFYGKDIDIISIEQFVIMKDVIVTIVYS